MGVRALRDTEQTSVLVGQYPHSGLRDGTVMSMELPLNELAHWPALQTCLQNSISIDPIDPNGYHFGFTADYLANRVCEPDLSQRFNGERFHPNAYYTLAVSEETGELWMEVWTTRILYRGEEVTIDYNYANRTTSYETPITQAKYMQSDAFQAAQQISTLYKKMGLELREDGGMNNPVTGFSIGTPARKSTVGKTKPGISAYPLEFQHGNAERWSETLE